MKILARSLPVLVAALLAAPPAFAQSYAQTAAPADSSAQAAFSDPELDQMLAPIALYPDELLSQILMASTYPLEVVQAARWSRANPDLQGDDAVSAVVAMDWDPSVKSLVAFPDVLQQMDRDLEWTQSLGEAFLADQNGVMASVQRLRTAALHAGNLASSDEIVVAREGGGIVIDSPSPDTVYVPYYDPSVVYGSWWWPAYPPVYWAPWPGYYSAGYGFAWTIGIPVGVDFFYGDFDWHRRHVRVYDHHPFYAHDRDHDHDRDDHRWRYDPHHRRDVQFRNPMARQEFANAASPPAAAVAQPRTAPLQRFFPQQRLPQRIEGRTGYAGQGEARSQPPGALPALQSNAQQLARPQWSAPLVARAPAAPQWQNAQRYVAPQPQFVPSRPQFVRPQPQYIPQPQYVPPQLPARPAAPTGVHAMPQFQHPEARPAASALARSAPAHPEPAAVQGPPQGGGEAPRGVGR